MKKILIIILTLIAAAVIVGGVVTREPAPAAPPADAPVTTLLINQIATFSDGLKIHLLNIDDSRCGPTETCVQEGELKATFELSGTPIPAPIEITLGTVNAKKAESQRYLIELTDATPTSVAIAVSKKQ